MISTLYTHVSDSGRFLLVRHDSAFPNGKYKLKEWRVVAVGVEAMTPVAEALLRTEGFYEYRAR